MATVPLTMSVSVKEEVVVTGEAPVIDTAKTTIGVTGTSEQISRLPLARNFTSVATTAPGTGTDNSGGITFYGATGLENQYIIDGVNTTGIKIGNAGKTLTNEFVQEVEVKTGGYEAEYGRALGGTINVVTKSGGNEFHGDAVRLLRQLEPRGPTTRTSTTARPSARVRSSRPRATTSARTSAATS